MNEYDINGILMYYHIYIIYIIIENINIIIILNYIYLLQMKYN